MIGRAVASLVPQCVHDNKDMQVSQHIQLVHIFAAFLLLTFVPCSPLGCRLELESRVEDKEEENEIFDLKKNSLDNLFYWSYGELALKGSNLHSLYCVTVGAASLKRIRNSLCCQPIHAVALLL